MQDVLSQQYLSCLCATKWFAAANQKSGFPGNGHTPDLQKIYTARNGPNRWWGGTEGGYFNSNQSVWSPGYFPLPFVLSQAHSLVHHPRFLFRFSVGPRLRRDHLPLYPPLATDFAPPPPAPKTNMSLSICFLGANTCHVLQNRWVYPTLYRGVLMLLNLVPFKTAVKKKYPALSHPNREPGTAPQVLVLIHLIDSGSHKTHRVTRLQVHLPPRSDEPTIPARIVRDTPEDHEKPYLSPVTESSLPISMFISRKV